MGDIELPDAMVDAHAGDQQALTFHRAAVHHASGVTGDQDEHLRCVGEHRRLERELGEEVIGDVVDEDGEQSKASKEIEPKVAFHSAAGHHCILRSNRGRRGPLDTIRGTLRGGRKNARRRRWLVARC